jgi:aminoglycoside phosphotransferase (APT) family kinase protein
MSSTPASPVVCPSRQLRSRSGADLAGSDRVQPRQDVIATQLLDVLGLPGLRYRSRPAPLGGGWETDSFSLEFESHEQLPSLLRGPLVLRLYATERGLPRARHEFAVQSFMHSQGFPTARPVQLVENDEVFGAPFLLMERLPGQSLFEVFRRRPWRLLDLPVQMAALHERLHRLSSEGFPDSKGDLLDESLDEIGARVTTYHLEGLQPGLSWLTANRPCRTVAPRIVHLDWHPLNLMYDGSKLSGLDWTEAGVGDRHADLATTLMTLLCYPMPSISRWQRPFVPLVRGIVARGYLEAYRRRLPVDEERLTYYSAWISLRRLARYGRWFCIGPASSGFKPRALQHVSSDHCATLCRYFTRHTGIEVSLESAG